MEMHIITGVLNAHPGDNNYSVELPGGLELYSLHVEILNKDLVVTAVGDGSQDPYTQVDTTYFTVYNSSDADTAANFRIFMSEPDSFTSHTLPGGTLDPAS